MYQKDNVKYTLHGPRWRRKLKDRDISSNITTNDGKFSQWIKGIKIRKYVRVIAFGTEAYS